MSRLLELARKMSALFRPAVDRELDEEMQAHRALIEQEMVASGMSPDEARYASRKRFGNATSLREQSRDVWTFLWLENLLRDGRFALRMLARTPAFSAVAILSLALGIGANAAVFTLIDAVLLEKLPVRAPEQLAIIERTSQSGDGPPVSSFSWKSFTFLRSHAKTLEGLLAASSMRTLTIAIGAESEPIPRGGLMVSGDYFGLLGVQPAAGRVLTPEDDRIPNGHPVLVLSHEYWMSRFSGAQTAIGSRVLLNDMPFTIVGVAARGFRGTSAGNAPDVFLPIMMDSVARRNNSQLPEETSWWISVMGRRRPGVSADQVASELTVLFRQQQLARTDMDSVGRANVAATVISVSPGASGFSGLRREYRKPLLILMGMVGVVLLIACANVATLLVARAAARQREIAVRMSIGAGRGRLVRQLLTESLVLAIAGAAAGLLLARWALDALLALIQTVRPVVLDLSPDARVLGFTIAIATAAALVFGVAPALGATRIDLTPALRSGFRGERGRGARDYGRLIVATQVALSLLLLVGAGLFARSLHRLRTVDTGFRQEGVLLVRMNPRRSGYRAERLRNLYSSLLERMAALPGVRSASITNYMPLSGSTSSTPVRVAGVELSRDASIVNVMRVAPGYFATLGTPVLRGRDLSRTDDASGRGVVLVNEAFVRAYLRDIEPLGHRVGFNTAPGAAPDLEIIGVVKDTKYESLRDPSPKLVYRSFFQLGGEGGGSSLGWATIVLRTAGDPTTLGPAVRRVVTELDPRLEVIGLTTLQGDVEATLGQERLVAFLASSFGILALLLASVGLYGVMSYGVSRRTGEIGIRMALGAGQDGVRWMVLRETLMTTVIGVLIGLPLALAASRFTRAMLYDLSPMDPVTIGGAILVLLLVAVIAGYVPARRAARLDPLVALRAE